MYIERIQVEDGFLDGLDLMLKPGMNTIIGARGTGKTSLIELIRFCFGASGHTAESNKRSREHAISVLGQGQIAITLRDGATAQTFTRSANDISKRESRAFLLPMIFSQTEIEAVALQPGGRLSLIDAFEMDHGGEKEQAIVAEISSLTARISAVRKEIEDLQASLAELPELNKRLSDLKSSEDSLVQLSAEIMRKTQALESHTAELSRVGVGQSALTRFSRLVDHLTDGLGQLTESESEADSWPSTAGTDPIKPEREELARVRRELRVQYQHLVDIQARISTAMEMLAGKRVPVEAQSRSIRREIDSIQAGAGEVTRQGQQLRERIAQAESLTQVADAKRKNLDELASRRGKLLDALDEMREKRFLSRKTIADSLNRSLGPRIRVTIERSGQYQTYSALIADVLRGSGLRYNELAPLVARNLSPRELLEAAETGDVVLISEATGITRDRAIRFATALRDADLARIATVCIEDAVTLSLLDGADYKSIEELSTGQRCTVVLPIVLRHTDRVVIVDQPEDHIDNAFIADTLIKAVLERNPAGQMIFSTHNANIPVLGEAEYVVQMGSDGHRGFPHTFGALDSPAVVRAISTVMEGGADAFKRRADFYRAHSDLP